MITLIPSKMSGQACRQTRAFYGDLYVKRFLHAFEEPKNSHLQATMRERTPFPKELISRLPNLKLLLTTGNRNLGLDLEAFKERGIPVAGVVDRAHPGSVGSISTAEHCVALILAAARNIAQDDFSVKTGGWQTVPALGPSSS